MTSTLIRLQIDIAVEGAPDITESAELVHEVKAAITSFYKSRRKRIISSAGVANLYEAEDEAR